MITKEQAVMIADLVRTVRASWDSRGIVSALAGLHHRNLAAVTAASLRAAADPAIRTPAGIALEGPHWTENDLTAAQERAKRERQERLRASSLRMQAVAACNWCDTEGRLENGYICPHDGAPDDRTAKAHAHASSARAAIRPPKLTEEPEGAA